VKEHKRDRSTGDRRAMSGEELGASGIASEGTRPTSFGSLVDWLTVVVPLATVAASLALWFGWTFTSERGAYLGIDQSLLEFAPTDYVLRSAEALILPAIVTSVVALIWLAAHGLLLELIKARRGLEILRIAGVLMMAAGAAGLLASVRALFIGFPDDSYYLLPPIVLGLSTVFVVEGAAISRRLRSADQSAGTWRRAVITILAMLIVLSLFWGFTLYAAALGRGRAAALDVEQLTSVVVYSDRSLALLPPVEEELVLTADSAYRYRYTGLRFLLRAADKYFLLPEAWTHESGGAVVVDDRAGIRLEYTPGD
jgi:hypothetical protein